ncbi:MAG: DUF4111 domain-containing protein [Chloroflexota bacterium]|nr:MAG: DUF4111 domain-containing protein [Chloroflexota bacterium]
MSRTTSTDPTPYKELNNVLRQLIEGMSTVLKDDFLGAYLQGSFAVGDFDIHSDVDFIVAIEQELSDGQVPALQDLHERIYRLECPWAQHLEGSYIPKDILRQHSSAGQELWYLDHGARSLVRSDHCNTIVVRWTVREHGLALAGPEPASLIDPIPVASLRREILSTINEWGQQILADPEQYNSRFYQGFITLSYCRMLHDLQAGDTGSKLAGAEWAKKKLDPSWAGLIDRAWSTRPDPATSVRQPADPREYRRTLAFVQYIMERSRSYAETFGIQDNTNWDLPQYMRNSHAT